MGMSVYYTSKRTVTDTEAEAIRSAAVQAIAGRSWLSCEPVWFFPGLRDGKLVGGSKPNLDPHPDDKRAAQVSGLPDGTVHDVVSILAQISKDHAVDWDLGGDFGELGCIRSGVPDRQLLVMLDGFAALPDILGDLEGEGLY